MDMDLHLKQIICEVWLHLILEVSVRRQPQPATSGGRWGGRRRGGAGCARALHRARRPARQSPRHRPRERPPRYSHSHATLGTCEWLRPPSTSGARTPRGTHVSPPLTHSVHAHDARRDPLHWCNSTDAGRLFTNLTLWCISEKLSVNGD